MGGLAEAGDPPTRIEGAHRARSEHAKRGPRSFARTRQSTSLNSRSSSSGQVDRLACTHGGRSSARGLQRSRSPRVIERSEIGARRTIAKRVGAVGRRHDAEDRAACRSCRPWPGLCCEMVSGALRRSAARDAGPKGKGRCACAIPRLDDLYNSMFRALRDPYDGKSPHHQPASHLSGCSSPRAFERTGDHATNIAEMVYYAATGRI